MRRLVGLAVAVSLCLCSCAVNQDEFPDIEYTSGSDVTSATEASSSAVATDPVIDITLALPYSDSTVDLLLRMYYAKKTDQFPEDQTGSDINLDYLSAIDLPWAVNTIQISSEGVGADTISSWASEGNMPDIMLVNDISSAFSTGEIALLDDYLYTLPINDAVNVNSLSSCYEDGHIAGLPAYLSVMVLVGNSAYIPESGVLPYRSTVTEFISYLSSISSTYEGVVPFADPYELMPYMPSAFNYDSPMSYMMLSEYEAVPSSVGTVLPSELSFVESLYDMYPYEVPTGDIRLSGNAAMWLTSSGKIKMWSDYYSSDIYLSLLPTSSSDSPIVPMANVYPLCVSATSSDVSFSSDLAYFLCFDPDALMLIYRLEPMTGYFPSVSTPSVWDQMYLSSENGAFEMLFEDVMDDMVVCPNGEDPAYIAVNSYLSSYFSGDAGEEEFDMGGCLP